MKPMLVAPMVAVVLAAAGAVFLAACAGTAEEVNTAASSAAGPIDPSEAVDSRLTDLAAGA